MLLRLPLEVRDLFREWLIANYPDRYRHVFKLVRDMRGGKDYDSTWGTRMKGTGPYAWMIGRRFEMACEKLGFNAARNFTDDGAFQKPRPGSEQPGACSRTFASPSTPSTCRRGFALTWPPFRALIAVMARKLKVSPRLPLSEPILRPDIPARERRALNKGIYPVAGCDEAGRGPLAGPVVAAAVVLDPQRIPRGLNDSKKLDAEEREKLYAKICATAQVAVAFGAVDRIDRDNILRASLWALARASRRCR